MKKFIIMSLALFAFALTVGCGKKDDASSKEKCEKDGKVYDEESKECKDKPVEETLTKEQCEAKAAEGYTWDEATSMCNAPAAQEEKVYTITNKLAEALTVTSGNMSVSLAAPTATASECANVKESQFPALVLASTAYNCDNGNKQADGTTDETSDDCEAKAANNYDVNPAVAADTTATPPVEAKAAGLSVSEAAGTNCKELVAQ